MGNFIAGFAAICIILFAIYRVYKDHKGGKQCGSGCGNCTCNTETDVQESI